MHASKNPGIQCLKISKGKANFIVAIQMESKNKFGHFGDIKSFVHCLNKSSNVQNEERSKK